MKTTNLEKLLIVSVILLVASCFVQRSGRIDAEASEKFTNGKLVEMARRTNIVIRPHYRGTVQIGTNFYMRTTDNKLEIK